MEKWEYDIQVKVYRHNDASIDDVSRIDMNDTGYWPNRELFIQAFEEVIASTMKNTTDRLKEYETKIEGE